MKKIIAAIILFMTMAVAFAMPSPKQIEQALAMNDMNSARSMVQEVLHARPDSAKAHLMNAYILIHADHNKVAANQELENVNRFDKKGDVKGSPLYGRVVTEIDLTKTDVVSKREVQQVTTQVRTTTTATTTNDHGNTIVVVLVVAAMVIILLVVIGVISEPGTPAYQPSVSQPVSQPVVHRNAYPQSTYSAPSPVYMQPTPVVVQQPVNNGMGGFGTAMSVAGGVVAGELMADALLGHGHSHGYRESNYDEYDDFRRGRESTTVTTTTTDYDRSNDYAAPTTSYESRSNSFSSGRSNDWDDTPSTSFSDSSWDDSGWVDSDW